MTHELSPDAAQAYDRMHGRLWLDELAKLCGVQISATMDAKGYAVLVALRGGARLKLKTFAGGTRWQACALGGGRSSKLQTGGKITRGGLEGAQRLILERCIKPLI